MCNPEATSPFNDPGSSKKSLCVALPFQSPKSSTFKSKHITCNHAAPRTLPWALPLTSFLSHRILLLLFFLFLFFSLGHAFLVQRTYITLAYILYAVTLYITSLKKKYINCIYRIYSKQPHLTESKLCYIGKTRFFYIKGNQNTRK